MKNNTALPRRNRLGRDRSRYFLLGCLLAAGIAGRVHAGVIWVEGEERCLVGLCHTDQLDDRPLVLFSETAPTSPDLLRSVSAIVLCRSSWRDLVFDFLPARKKLSGRQTFDIPEDGTYEIYVKLSPAAREEAFLPVVSLDGEALKTESADPQKQSRLYHRVARVFLRKGGHTITCAPEETASFYLVSAAALAGTEKELLEILRERDVRFSFITDQPQGEIVFPDIASVRSRRSLRLHLVFSELPVSGNEEGPASNELDGELEIGVDVFALDNMPAARSADLRVLTQTFAPTDNEMPFHLSGHKLALKWIAVEPVAMGPAAQEPETPTLFVRRYSPSKYYVRIRGAQDPFWLVLGERYHQYWRLYAVPNVADDLFSTVSETFRSFNVQESEPTAFFDVRDIGYLFKRPLGARDVKVNGFANGWLIDPAKEGLIADFDLVVFFWPQAFFYLGMLLTGLVFLCAVLFVLFRRRSGL